MVEYVSRRRKRSKAKEEQLSLVFHVLSDGTRRQIIELLREAGELKVGDLAQAFSMSLNGVSKHLKVLEKAGLIQRRIEGREHWIRVSWATLQQPYEWLHFYQHFWGERLDALVDYVQAKGKRT
jgi:DNA-binding transcriptional ArsR family regulator